ncbi:hypothetical protein BDB00DRAFT_792730 [Zychaea mexicana]|uniref:uncharacterized protein n=1 Tax=Zychaea mexicana TaxID=64656 RepID=UPI0022FE3B53|nr:uncharacterized protein BDB00DRAFT_792730 [Zychaea mexicana]KAI9484576.1 hypothetical protein BDB00DRAFT_792730 [Zychaea mexicana]
MRAVTDTLSPSSSSSWRLPMNKRKAKSRPTSMTHDDNDDAASAYTVDSSKASGSSLFTSLFAKKGSHAKYGKENASMHDLSSSSSTGPKPSRSTPIAPFNRSPRMWLQNADRTKRHSSDSMDKQGNEQLPPPSLPLPELSATPNDEDYFGFGSVGASDLLMNTTASRYSVLSKPTPIKKNAATITALSDDTSDNIISSNKRLSSNNKYYLSVDPLLEEAATSMDDVMDTLVKVLEKSNEAVETDAAAPSIVPPPRKQSIPKHAKKDSTSSRNSRNDMSAVTLPVERSKSSSSTTSSSASASSSSPPLVPASSSSSNNNGQGLSSFWRAHTFSARRPGQQQQSSNHSQRTSKKKHEPSLPPLNLQSNNPPTSRASSTRTRSASNASAASRHSVASSSSPTTISSPSSQTSSRNGWSSFDLQSRPNTSLFSASVPSLALSPKERTQFMEQPKIDPAVFLSDPEPKAGVNDLPLTQRILRCLVDGGYLTDKLYVPKQLW